MVSFGEPRQLPAPWMTEWLLARYRTYCSSDVNQCNVYEEYLSEEEEKLSQRAFTLASGPLIP